MKIIWRLISDQIDAAKVHLFLNHMYSVFVQLVAVTMMRFVGI